MADGRSATRSPWWGSDKDADHSRRGAASGENGRQEQRRVSGKDGIIGRDQHLAAEFGNKGTRNRRNPHLDTESTKFREEKE